MSDDQDSVTTGELDRRLREVKLSVDALPDRIAAEMDRAIAAMQREMAARIDSQSGVVLAQAMSAIDESERRLMGAVDVERTKVHQLEVSLGEVRTKMTILGAGLGILASGVVAVAFDAFK